MAYVTVGKLTSGADAQLAPLPAKWWALFVEMVRSELGLELEIIQARGLGSKSGGTHADGWAVDIRTWKFTRAQVEALVALARRCGASATWYRTKAQGFDPHIHLVVDSGATWTASRYQTVAVRAGYNGLGSGGRGGQDTHPAPRPWRTGAQGIDYMEDAMALSTADKTWIAAQIAAIKVPTTTDIVVALLGQMLGRSGPAVGTAIQSTYNTTRALAQREGVDVDVDEAVLAQELVALLAPAIRDAVTVEVAARTGASPDAVADAVVARLGAALTA